MSVIKAIEFPDLEFNTKEELFKHLKENKDRLIGIKKAQVRPSDSIQVSKVSETKGIDVAEGKSLHVINTTKYVDSHNDVHLDGIWNKSVSEQKGKIYFLADHDLSMKSVIAYPSDVEISLKMFNWSDLGADYEGKTQALLFEVDKNDIQLDSAKTVIEKGIDIQHSVRMQYVDIKLAVNSDSEDLAQEKIQWDSTIDSIANKGVAFERGYYWTVSEAKIFKEGSMVLAGSNDVTPMILSKDISSSLDANNNEPSNDTQKKNNNDDLLTQFI